MTMSEEATKAARRSQPLWRAFAAFGIFVIFLFSLAVVLVTAMKDEVLVRSRADLASVDLGWPLVWAHQDLSSHDPPLPAQLGFDSPWENPTSVSWGALAVDVLVVFAAISVVVVALTAALMVILRGRSAATPR
jgi:hypothetical protein